MNKKEYYATIVFLFPNTIDKLKSILTIPTSYITYVGKNIGEEIEAGVHIYKSEKEKNFAINYGDCSFGSELSAMIVNNGEERRISLTVKKSIAPNWENESQLDEDLKTVILYRFS